MTICDPLCENPAKVIFLWFAVFYKTYPSYGKNIPWKLNLYICIQYWLSKVTSKIKIIVKLMVEIKLWCLLSHNWILRF